MEVFTPEMDFALIITILFIVGSLWTTFQSDYVFE